MRYMSSFNDWLERDVENRQAELWAATDRVDQLRENLQRTGFGAAPGRHYYFDFVIDLSQLHLRLNLEEQALVLLFHHRALE